MDTINIVIENSALYSVLKQNEGLTQEKYKKKDYKAIEKGILLSVDRKSLNELKPYLLIKDSEVEELSAKGINVLIDAFFRDGVQSKEITESTKSCLIHSLFMKKQIVRKNDDSGLLSINKN